MFLVSAIILGLLGSLHCTGMCGPIVMYLSTQSGEQKHKIWFYHIGRIFTYALLGLASGSLGGLFTWAGFPKFISFISGALLVVFSLLGIFQKHHWKASATANVIFSYSKNLLRLSPQSDSNFYYLLFGFVNGLLPCGILYTALVASAASSHIVESMIFMILFGLGTSPALSLVYNIKNILSSNSRLNLYKLMPYWTLILGVLFILRALQLGIPFLSPNTSPHNMMDSKACVVLSK